VTPVDFYFDYVSPYAYFAWLRIGELCAARGNVELRIHPVLFAGLLDHWGQRGPAEVPPRRAWVFRDGARYAARHGIPLAWPAAHPFNPLLALRLSLPGTEQRRVISAIFDAGWARGGDLGAPEQLRRALDDAGLDGAGRLAAAAAPEVKAALRAETDAAIARGVFGVPTMIAGDELFWGSDRLDDLAAHLDGRDPLDDAHRARLREVMARPRAADRKLPRGPC
jgi:2-hydroxychromene-2-carboxylate isomerase